MRRQLSLWPFICTIIFVSFLNADCLAQTHPKLLLDATRIEALKAMTHPTGDPEFWSERKKIGRLLYRSITTGADTLLQYDHDHNYWIHDGVNRGSQGGQSSGLRVLGLAWILTQDDGHSNHAQYAAHVLYLLDEWKARGYPTWELNGGSLGRAELLQGWSLASDWLWSEMTPERKTNNIEAIQDLAAYVRDIQPSWVWNGPSESNYTAHCAGAVGLASLFLEDHLSGDDEVIRLEHYNKSIERAVCYIDCGFGPDGGGYEGLMYCSYGMQGVLPFALAMERLGRGALVDVMNSLNIQQAANWMCFCAAPWDYDRFLNFNDSYSGGGELRVQWKGAGWLMGFANPNRPSAIRHFIDTQFRVHDWGYYLGYPTLTPFPSNGVSTSLLISWPDELFPPSAFSHPPSDFRLSTWFKETGMTVWRTGFHDLDQNNTVQLHENGQGTVIGFFLNETPDWGTPRGHAQHDLNSFTINTLGETLFSDSGYGGWGDDDWKTAAHNSIMINDKGTEYFSSYNRHGDLIRHLYAKGDAPCLTTGDSTRAWCIDIWDPIPHYADLAQRHFLIMPRAADAPPYVLVYDDVDVGPFLNHEAIITNQWHAGDRLTDFNIDGAAQTAIYINDNAAAKMTVLSPSGVTMDSTYVDVTNSENQDHYKLTIDTDVRENADLVSLIDLYSSSGSPTLTATEIDLPEGYFGYRIEDGSFTDLVVFRRAGEKGLLTLFTLDDKLIRTDATMFVLRFNSASLDYSNITAGLLVEGTAVSFDGQVVMAVNGTGGIPGDMTFSSDEVTVNAVALIGDPEYYVGPVTPSSAFVNGIESAVSMKTPAPANLLGLIPFQRVQLTWTPNPLGHNVTGYKIYKSADRKGPFALLATVSGGAVAEYSDTQNITIPGSYYYRIRAITPFGEGLLSPVRIALPMADLIGGYGPGMEDGKVVLADYSIFGSLYGGGYSPEIDFTEDGEENLDDFSVFGQWFNWHAE